MDRILKPFKHVEEIYSELVEGLNDIIAATDLDGRFLYISASVEQKLGYKPSELIGKKTIDFIHPDDHTQFTQRAFDKKTEILPVVEYRLRAKNGDYRWYKSLSKKLELGDNILGRFGVLNDISEQKEFEEKLLRSEIKYKNIFQNILDVYVETSIDGVVLEISPSIKDLLGYTREEMLGKSGHIHYVEIEDRNRHVNALKEKGKSSNHDIALYHKDGSIIPVSVSAVISRASDGKEYIISMVRDERERRKTEKLLRDSEDRLRQAQKMEAIGNLAGGIAHEFNNILSIIIGNNELVMDELPESSLARQSTEEIRIAGRRARDIVKQLLTFSRKGGTVKKSIDIKISVQDSLKLLRSSSPSNIEIEQSLSDGFHPVFGNATQINQLLINLGNNAIDAMPDSGGVLAVELTNETVDEKNHEPLPPGHYVKLTVRDNGCGMDAETLSQVFDPYFTTKEIGKGTGIGLAVVHGIVEQHGGTIIADSKLGQGTTFTIFLPRHEGVPEDSSDAKIDQPVGSETVLFVDDEPSIAKLGVRLLRSLGYTVESTTDPMQALELVKAAPNKFDLVISDMTMPKMTGDQLVAEILKYRSDMPIIICTGYSSKISDKEAAKIGIPLVMKPLDKTELAEVVRETLHGSAGRGNKSQPR